MYIYVDENLELKVWGPQYFTPQM